MDPLVQRINQLYKKQKAGTLTAEEQSEQERLRRQYVDQVKENLAQTLDNTVIVRPDGTRTAVKPKKSPKRH